MFAASLSFLSAICCKRTSEYSFYFFILSSFWPVVSFDVIFNCINDPPNIFSVYFLELLPNFIATVPPLPPVPPPVYLKSSNEDFYSWKLFLVKGIKRLTSYLVTYQSFPSLLKTLSSIIVFNSNFSLMILYSRC